MSLIVAAAAAAGARAAPVYACAEPAAGEEAAAEEPVEEAKVGDRHEQGPHSRQHVLRSIDVNLVERYRLPRWTANRDTVENAVLVWLLAVTVLVGGLLAASTQHCWHRRPCVVGWGHRVPLDIMQQQLSVS